MRRGNFYLLVLLVVVLVFSDHIYAQNTADTAIKIDNLKAPVSPASNLLGLSPSDVEKPTDPSALMLTIRSASDGFSAFPNKYAVDIAPFLLFSKQGVSIKDLQSVKFRDLAKQSFVLSTAINQISKADNKEDTIDVTRIGLGFKISLIRGTINSDFLRAIRKIKSIQKNLLDEYDKEDDYADADPKYKELTKKINQIISDGGQIPAALITEKAALYERLIAEFNNKNTLIKKSKKEIKDSLDGKTLDRYGWFLDLSGGVVMDFRNNQFENNKISKAGAWITFGHDDLKGFSVLWIARYLYSPELVLAKAGLSGKNIQSFDMGGRLLYKTDDKKFLLSGEAIYRSILEKSIVDPSWRIMFNASYEIGFNQKLIFSFGRNFDGTYFRGGNLGSGIQFLIGLGKQKFNAIENN
jgi:hypothetical protein